MELSTKQANNKSEKIKALSAEIVVHGTIEKPYYEIKYYDLSDRKYHIGYSSYDLNNVLRWKDECFEIVKELRKYCVELDKYGGNFNNQLSCTIHNTINTIEALSTKLQAANMERSAEDCGRWILCSERLPEKYTECLIRYYNSKEGKRLTDIAWIDEEGYWQLTREKGGYFPVNFKKEITHWMPLPED